MTTPEANNDTTRNWIYLEGQKSPLYIMAKYNWGFFRSETWHLMKGSLINNYGMCLGIAVLSAAEGAADGFMTFNFTKFLTPIMAQSAIQNPNNHTFLYTSLLNLWGLLSISNYRASLIAALCDKAALDYRTEYEKLTIDQGALVKAQLEQIELYSPAEAERVYKEQVLAHVAFWSDVICIISGVVCGYFAYTMLMPSLTVLGAAYNYAFNAALSLTVSALGNLFSYICQHILSLTKLRSSEIRNSLEEVNAAIQNQPLELARTKAKAATETAQNLRKELQSSLAKEAYASSASSLASGLANSFGIVEGIAVRLLEVALGTYSLPMFIAEAVSINVMAVISSEDRTKGSNSLVSGHSWKKFAENHKKARELAGKRTTFERCTENEVIATIEGEMTLPAKPDQLAKTLSIQSSIKLTPGLHLFRGPNGAGKSTLANILHGTYLSGENSSYAKSIKITKCDTLIEKGREVQIPKTFPKLPGVSLYDWLLDLVSNREGYTEERLLSTINQLKEELLPGFPNITKETNVTGSDGQIVRLNFLRALLPGALDASDAIKLITIDEALSNVDPDGKRSILQTIHELSTRFGTCVLLISHEEEESLGLTKGMLTSIMRVTETPESNCVVQETIHLQRSR